MHAKDHKHPYGGKSGKRACETPGKRACETPGKRACETPKPGTQDLDSLLKVYSCLFL